MYFKSERRQEERYSYPIQLQVHPSSEFELEAPFPVKTWNISQDGVSFEIPKCLDLKKKYRAEIHIKPDVVILAQLKIVWVVQKGHRKYFHGAQLFFPSENQSNLLFDFFIGLEKNFEDNIVDRRTIIRRDPKLMPTKRDKRKLDRRFPVRLSSSQMLPSKKPTVTRSINLRRVVITGLGVLAPNGLGKDNYTEAIRSSKSGIRTLSRISNDDYTCQSGGEISDDDMSQFLESEIEVDDLTFTKKILRRKRMERSVYFSLVASYLALKDSNLNLKLINRTNIGVSMGSIMGGLSYAFKEHDTYYAKGMNRMDPYTVAAASPNSLSGEIAANFNLKGPSVSFSQGCTSGAMAIAYAFEQIQKGVIPLMVAGGADTPFTASTYAAFCRSGMMAPSLNGKPVFPKPLDKERNGIVLGEGAGTLILEDYEHALARKAPIYGEILSTSNTCDGFDMIRWRWHGTETARAIKTAISEANLKPKDISTIFAQAAGTYQGDEIENRAFTRIFGKHLENIPVTNVKSMVGYTQGACAPIELISACLSMRHKFIPGIGSIGSPLNEKLNVSSKVRPMTIKSCLVNCIGFGGKNIALILSKI